MQTLANRCRYSVKKNPITSTTKWTGNSSMNLCYSKTWFLDDICSTSSLRTVQIQSMVVLYYLCGEYHHQHWNTPTIDMKPLRIHPFLLIDLNMTKSYLHSALAHGSELEVSTEIQLASPLKGSEQQRNQKDSVRLVCLTNDHSFTAS